MVTFREYLLEYATKQNSQFFGISKLKAGSNGKLIGDTGRVNQNAFKQEFIHKHPIIDNICRGKTNNVQVAGQPLLAILAQYDTKFEPGIKNIGNSCAEVEMYVDNNGVQRGIFKNKTKTNVLQP